MKLPILELQSRQLQEGVGDPYLKLQLGTDISTAIPMVAIREVLVVNAEQISPIPNMPSCVVGLLNQRSRVFWVADLSTILGLEPLNIATRQYNIVIIESGAIPLGLAVPTVKGVMRFPAELIQSPIGSVSPSIAPYLRGCLPQEQDILLVLDPDAILDISMLQAV